MILKEYTAAEHTTRGMHVRMKWVKSDGSTWVEHRNLPADTNIKEYMRPFVEMALYRGQSSMDHRHQGVTVVTGPTGAPK